MAEVFQVVYFIAVKEKVQKSFRRVRNTELEAPFVAAATTIPNSLSSNPRQFGDPCYSSSLLELDFFVRAVHPLIVYYGVHRIEPIVFVNRLEVFELEVGE